MTVAGKDIQFHRKIWIVFNDNDYDNDTTAASTATTTTTTTTNITS